ncbi:hypothetical protein [Sporosarcina sp. FSL W7-1283]
MTVLGFDQDNVARAVEVEVGDKVEAQKHFEDIGWTSIIFLE